MKRKRGRPKKIRIEDNSKPKKKLRYSINFLKVAIVTSTEVLRRSPQWALNTHTHTETERKREVNK